MDEYKYIDIRFDIHDGYFSDKHALLSWISEKLGSYSHWTFGTEKGYKTGKLHFHLRVKYYRSQALAKTHIGQQFKTWLKRQGGTLYKNGFWIKTVTDFTADEKHFFAYCLKDVKKLTEDNYFGFSNEEILEIHTIGTTLKKKQIKVY